MSFNYSVCFSALIGFLGGAAFVVTYLSMGLNTYKSLEVQELRIVSQDNRIAATLASGKGGAVLRFYEPSDQRIAAEFGVNSWSKFLLYHGKGSTPVAGLVSISSGGASSLYLGEDNVSPRVILGAMLGDQLNTGYVEGWTLQFRNPHNTSESLFRILVREDQQSGKPAASLQLNNTVTTALSKPGI